MANSDEDGSIMKSSKQLNMSYLGIIPNCSGMVSISKPVPMVKVFPEPVCPYAKQVTFAPKKAV